MSRVILFAFGGRRANVELQLPFLDRILREHPEVEVHYWNLARDFEDGQYLRSLDGTHERFLVINDFYGPDPWTRFDWVYRYYADDKFADATFVKLDDDVIFIETERFNDFLVAIEQNPEAVMSAKVVNNGACTATEDALWKIYKDCRIRLLDVHMNGRYALRSHMHFLENWESMVDQKINEVPTTDWLSINLIGYNHDIAKQIAAGVGGPSPRMIAGRPFPNPRCILGDEGMVNTLPRIIFEGFTACHLYFGPQVKKMGDLTTLRELYGAVGQKYLSR